MTVKSQMEPKKNKKDLLDDLVIEAIYIQDIATHVLDDEDARYSTPSFEELCDNLRSVCDELVASTKAIKKRIPKTECYPSQYT